MNTRAVALGTLSVLLSAAPAGAANAGGDALPDNPLTIDVRACGATGDGVTDDTAALRRAADALARGRPKTSGIAYDDDGPTPAVVFPAGTYRVSGPVVFTGNAVLLGEGGARVVNASPTNETFVFSRSRRVIVRDLAFEGGRTQLRDDTENLDICYFHVADCRFRGAGRVAVEATAFRADREGRLRPNNNSTLILIERSLFEDNAASVLGWSDGMTVRACRFVAPRGAREPQLRYGEHGCFGIESFGRDLVFEYPGAAAGGRAAIAQDGGRLRLERVTVRGEGVAAVRSTSRAGEYYNPELIDLRDVALATGSSAVVSFAEGTLPNIFSAYGVRAADGVRKRLAVFDAPPTTQTVGRIVAGMRFGRQRGGPRANFALRFDRIDPAEVDCTLPPVLADCRRPSTAARARPFAARGGETFAAGAPAGARFADLRLGHLNRYAGGDDTDALAALLARAGAAGGGTVELPPRWLRLSRPVRLPGGVRLTCRGIAVLEGASGDADLIAVGEGVSAVENIIFAKGRHALTVAAGARLTILDCRFWAHRLHAIAAETPKPGQALVELTGGQAVTPYFYRGNARFTADVFWCSILPERKKGEMRPSFAASENLPGGVWHLREMLGVPCYFCHYPKSDVYDFSRHPLHPERSGRFRWIDNRGTLVAVGNRFGGEWGGLTPIYHFAGAVTHWEGGVDECCCPWLLPGRAGVVTDAPGADVTVVDVLMNAAGQSPAIVTDTPAGFVPAEDLTQGRNAR